jgi:hypothetical protein
MMMKIRTLMIFAALALLCALPGPAFAQERGRGDSAAPAKAGEAAAAPKAGDIFFCTTDTSECRTSAGVFPLDALRDLYVFVTWPKLSGNFVQTVEFVLPDGNVYLRKQTAFAVRSGQARARAVKGSGQPERYFTTSRGAPAVVTSLPVAGTYITQRNLSGVWKVRVYLDGNLAGAAQFKLEAPAQKAARE